MNSTNHYAKPTTTRRMDTEFLSSRNITTNVQYTQSYSLGAASVDCRPAHLYNQTLQEKINTNKNKQNEYNERKSGL